jgi:hypothetical protein
VATERVNGLDAAVTAAGLPGVVELVLVLNMADVVLIG